MFQILQPILLFLLAGIAVPLIIHMWNIREGKILQVGSILLLKESAALQARSLRLHDILLLIVRCLLILALAFLAAKPIWRKQLTATDEKGWIMIEKQSVHEAHKNFKPLIDSLVEAGYKFHYFNKGFELGNLEDALMASASINHGTEFSYWHLLKQLNEQVPAELPVYLFTDNRLKRFKGTRPQISMNFKWYTYTANDTINKSIVKAFETSEDSIRIIISNGRPEATSYTSQNILNNNNNNNNSKYRFSNSNGKRFINAMDTTITNSVEVDTATLNVAIYTDQFITDAQYVKAAIDAIQQFTKYKIKTSLVKNPDAIKQGMDWLFWLSEKSLPLQLLPANVFVYQKGTEQQINSWITQVNEMSFNQEPIHLSRYILNSTLPPGNFETKWLDGFGHPLLVLEKTTNNIYHFYSRFNPGWNDLPWNPHFAEMIFELLINPGIGTKNFDNRMIDATQIQPVLSKKAKTFHKEKFIETTDLTKIVWLVVFIIFCIERYISFTGNKQQAHAGNKRI